MPKKYLIIRFSSFGDIAQGLEAARRLNFSENSKVHWLTRSDFAEFLENFNCIDQVWSFDKKLGIKGLFQLSLQLVNENYTHVYDAHNNLRSHFVCLILRLLYFNFKCIRRSKYRFRRFLLFTFRWNLFPKPFKGQESYNDPIKKWVEEDRRSSNPANKKTLKVDRRAATSWLKDKESKYESRIVLAPSANWELKRWPQSSWKELVERFHGVMFYIVGGPQDEFCHYIAELAPGRCINLAGQLSWNETSQLVAHSQMVISGDTGVMHLADLFGKPTICLIGPTAFGFPTHQNSIVLETPLWCRPCTKDGRGRCWNETYKLCLNQINPQTVIDTARTLL